MFKVLHGQQLDDSINAFMTRKLGKVKSLEAMPKGGIKKCLNDSQRLMNDSRAGGYIWSEDTQKGRG